MDKYGVKSEESQSEEQPHAECSKKPEEDPNEANKSEPLKILLETREKRGLPRRKNSECSCQHSQISLGSCCASPSIVLQSNSLHSISSQVYHSSLSCGSTISSIHSNRHLTESQTSGYTTESSYQTATERESNLTYNIYDDTYHHSLPSMLISNNQLQEIHVSIDGIASVAQIQAVYESLRNLLSNEIELIRVLSDGSRDAVYVIAYSLM